MRRFAPLLLLAGGAAHAQVNLNKTAPQPQAYVGSPFAYDLRLSVGPGTLQPVFLRDPLPAPSHTLLSVSMMGTTVDCTSAPSGTLGPGITVTCDEGGGVLRVDFPAGPSSRTVTVSYRAGQPGLSTNRATACNSTMTDCQTAQASVDVVAPAVSITKTGPTSARAGGQLTYNLEVSNGGPAALAGVTVDDPLPAGEALASITVGGATFSAADLASPKTAPDGATVSLGGASVRVALPSIVAGRSYAFKIVAALDAAIAEGTTLSNVASATVGGVAVPSAAAVTTVSARAPPLQLDKRVRPESARVGDTVRYTLTVTPEGAQAGPITVEDPLDRALRATEVRLDGRTVACGAAAAIAGGYALSCGADGRIALEVPAGATLARRAELEVSAVVLPSAGAQVPNLATLTDAGGAKTEAVAPLTILGGADAPRLALTAGKPLAARGDLVPFVAAIGLPAGLPAIADAALELQPTPGLRVGDVLVTDDAGLTQRATLSEGAGTIVVALPPLQPGALLSARVRARLNGRTVPGKESLTVRLVSMGAAVATARAEVRVIAEPDFDLGTILGEVYRDDDGDGRRGRGEPPIEGAQVVLDDGLVAVTDAAGRYHLAAVQPGDRALKVAAHTLPHGARFTTDETRILAVTPGVVLKVDFGVSVPAPAPPAARERPLTDAPELTPLDGGALRYRVALKTTPGSRVYLDGKPAPVSPKDGAYPFEARLQPGRNRSTVVTAYPDGRVVIAVRDLYWVKDAGRIIPRPDAARLTLRLPPGPLAEPTFTLEGALERSSPPLTQLTVAGQPVAIDKAGRIGVRVRLPEVGGALRVAARFADGVGVEFDPLLEAGGNFVVLVGLAEGKIGYVERSGGLRDSGGGLYAQGRVKLYVKGRIRGRYLLEGAVDLDSAQMESWRDLFRADPQRAFRNLDPDRFYTVYGDSSRTVENAPTRARLFVRLQLDRSELVLGNVQTGLTGVELGQYSRAVTGARLSFVRASDRPDGQPSTQVILFGAWLQTARAHDELRGTGGSLYYLSRRHVVEGSEQVRVELRDRISGRPMQNQAQRATVDYEIDYLAGRVMLREPLSSFAQTGGLVRSGLNDGDHPYLLVDYEYVVDGDLDDGVAGARVTQWIGPLRLGGTVVNEFRALGGYTLVGADAQLDLKSWGALLGEYAYSLGSLTAFQRSDDGGLSYAEALGGQANPRDRDGNAWKAEADLHHFGVRLRPYVRGIDQGYVDTAHAQDAGLLQWGAQAEAHFLGCRLELHYDERRSQQARFDATGGALPTADAQEIVRQIRRDAGGEIGRAFGPVTVRVGARTERVDDPEPTRAGARSAVAARLDVRVARRLTLYGSGQYAFEHSGQGLFGRDTSLGALGAIASLPLEARVQAEASYGVQGAGGLLSLRLPNGPGRVLYGTVTLSQDRDDRVSTQVAAGGRERLGDASGRARLTLYAEDQFRDGPLYLSGPLGAGRERAHMQTAGVDVPIGRRFLFGATFERGSVEPSGTAFTTLKAIERDAGTASASYAGERLRAQARGEVRYDRPDGGDRQLQWLVSGLVTVRPHRDLTLRAKVFFSRATAANATAARSSEASFGFAWRPSFTDRLALLGRYTYLDEGVSTAQAAQGPRDPATGLPLLQHERAHVLSLGGEGRLFWRLQLGEKIAAKRREEPDEGTAAWLILWVNRLSLHVTRAWDVVAEYRLLVVPSATLQHGVSVEVNRIIVGHLRLGAGWNFADFSDEELRLGRGSERGFFIRAQGFY